MSRKKAIIVFLLLAAIVAAFIGYREYNRTNEDLSDIQADFKVEAGELIGEFETNDTLAYNKYRNKILSVSGNIRQLDTADDHTTIILGDTSSMSSVRCSLDSNYRAGISALKPGTKIKVKGAITGFKKDDLGIGSDVELNRCVIEK